MTYNTGKRAREEDAQVLRALTAEGQTLEEIRGRMGRATWASIPLWSVLERLQRAGKVRRTDGAADPLSGTYWSLEEGQHV